MEIRKTKASIDGKPQSFSKGTAVTGAGGFVFLSGTTGISVETGETPSGLGEQVTISLDKIKTRLEELGSSLEYIMHIWMYLVGSFPDGITHSPEWPEFSKAWEKFWEENCPELHWKNNPTACTLVGVTSLAEAEMKTEIQVIAAIP